MRKSLILFAAAFFSFSLVAQSSGPKVGPQQMLSSVEMKIMLHGEEFEDRYTDAECEALFASLFLNGFSGDDVRAGIAPEGWEHSALYFVFHPTPEQLHQEVVQMHRNISEFGWGRRPAEQPEPEPTIEDIRSSHQDIPLDERREIRELVAMCLWDIFSNEHDVMGRGGRRVHLGSFRGTAGFLAECLNRQYGLAQYDYLDFYMGTFQVSDRADLTPVYEMIFRRLKERFLDWRYSFPEVQLVDFSPDERSENERRELDKMRFDLKQARQQEIENARLQPVPEIVVAYRNVYDTFPHGWPPWDQQDE